MANLPWSYKIKHGQSTNPVIFCCKTKLDKSVPFPNEIELKKVFKADGYKLQTWGRAITEKGKVKLENDPHWIAVRKGTPLHYDPAYPRYSHHLKVRVDDGIGVRGLDKRETVLERGVFYILDTHSPHQVFHKNKQAIWNVAVSIDSSVILEPDEVIPIALEYAKGGVVK